MTIRNQKEKIESWFHVSPSSAINRGFFGREVVTKNVMSLKILKQQLKEIVVEEEPKERKPRKLKRGPPMKEDKFTRTRKVMKKNMKPKTQTPSLENSVNKIKEGFLYSSMLMDQKLRMQKKERKKTKNGI